MKKLDSNEMVLIYGGITGDEVMECVEDKLLHRGWTSVALSICCAFSPWSLLIVTGACVAIPKGTLNW